MAQKEMYKEKAAFVKKLQLFYIKDCRNAETIKRLDYYHDELLDEEFVYVTFMAPDAQKRIDVRGRNEQGIFILFAKFLQNHDSYHWLWPADFKEEFTEDE